MKFTKKILIVILTLILSVPFFSKSTNAYYSSPGFSFSNLDIVIDVSEKGIFTITETYDVDFTSSLHGIYINIPTKYTDYTWTVDGLQLKKNYFWPVSNIEVLSSHQYKIEKNYEGVMIRLGSPDYYADKHETYKIKYVIHSDDLDLNGIQTFYYNVVGNRWSNDIYNSTFTINMPKSFDSSKLYFYTDGYDVDPNLKYKIDGNTISGSLNTTISYGRGITVKLDLPNDYFDFSNDNTYLYIIIAIATFMMIIFLFIWQKYGKDDQIIPTVEFEAPKELSSAGVGYIIKNSVDNRDVASLFLEWANKGYITITDTKNDLIFTKVKEINADEHKYSKVFFNKIFRKKQSVSSKDLEGEYNSYYDAQNDIRSYFQAKNRRVFSQISDSYQVLLTFLTVLPISIACGYAIYTTYYESFISLSVALAIAASLISGIISAIAIIKIGYSNNTFAKIALYLVTFILIFISFGLTLGCSSFANMPIQGLLILWVITIINVVISSFMQKRTKFGVDMLGKVLGLKDFIEHAEKDRLNMLFEQDPQIYYKVLPYAYVLGLTKVWTKHFNDMEMVKPDWYVGDQFVYNRFYSNMTHSMSSVSNPTPPAPSGRSGGGGGFSGGGFSGGGGGGFSGGGFGGSSGGGW